MESAPGQKETHVSLGTEINTETLGAKETMKDLLPAPAEIPEIKQKSVNNEGLIDPEVETKDLKPALQDESNVLPMGNEDLASDHRPTGSIVGKCSKPGHVYPQTSLAVHSQ